MSLEIKLQVFEGPMDLLMHLIDKNQIDIYDIPIVTITEQYMEYITAMQKEDMEIASEFLVMAATLMNIKCKMLLPREKNEEGEETGRYLHVKNFKEADVEVSDDEEDEEDLEEENDEDDLWD